MKSARSPKPVGTEDEKECRETYEKESKEPTEESVRVEKPTRVRTTNLKMCVKDPPKQAKSLFSY